MLTYRKPLTWLMAALLCTTLALAGAPKAHAGDLTSQLQEMVAGLSAEQQAALYLLLTELRGGASGGAAASGPSPEVALKDGIASLIKAAKNNDLDALMNMVSDEFDYYQVGDKDALRGFIKGAMDAGYIEMYIDDVEVDTTDAEIEEKDGEYTIYPIEISGPFGSITVEIVAVQEGGQFKVKTLDIYGI